MQNGSSQHAIHALHAFRACPLATRRSGSGGSDQHSPRCSASVRPIRHQHGSRRSCSVPLQFGEHSRDQQPRSATARRSERRQPSVRRMSTIFLMQSQLNSVNHQCVVACSVCASDSRLDSYIDCFHIAKRHDRGQR